MSELIQIGEGVYEHPWDDGQDGHALARPLADDDMYGGWVPEAEPYEDLAKYAFETKPPPKISPRITPSQFTAFAFRMPTVSGWENFSFNGRRHLYQPYDTPARRILLVAARQVEKSTLIGNKIITLCCLIQAYKVLYVSPSATQSKTFSNDRLKDPLVVSPVLRTFTSHMLSQNVFEKQFINMSKVSIRSAFLNPDRARGIPSHALCLDELQDILSDNIPVLEQNTGHAPEELRRFIYAGTPKSLDNVIENYRAKQSTQGEWVVPHDCTGGEAGRYWNILGEKNIGKKSLICEKCGGPLDPMNPDAQWAWMVEWDPIHAPFESYRIPQLMVPWLSWTELLYNYEHYPRNRFYNECLGISYDTGLRPLTTQQVKACSRDDIRMSDVAQYRKLAYSQEVYAGIDWGSDGTSRTVLSLGTYVGPRFRIFYVEQFIGEYSEPEKQLEKIEKILRAFNVVLIGVDYGGGFHPNSFLLRKFGVERVQKYQYVARLNAKVRWDKKLLRWMVHRTEIMSAIFTAIKRGTVFEFPRWEEFRDPYGQDMLNIYSEYNEKLRMTQYEHTPGTTDDTFHSILYCFLVSMIRRPRPDVIAPRREDPNTGAIVPSYTGPTRQQ